MTARRIPILASFFIAAALMSQVSGGAAIAEEKTEKVKGYFCDTRSDLVQFLTEIARGESEVIAANAVNKSRGKQTCAFYLSLNAIAKEEKNHMERGVVYVVKSFIFLPERAEKWSGSTIGSLSNSARRET